MPTVTSCIVPGIIVAGMLLQAAVERYGIKKCAMALGSGTASLIAAEFIQNHEGTNYLEKDLPQIPSQPTYLYWDERSKFDAICGEIINPDKELMDRETFKRNCILSTRLEDRLPSGKYPFNKFHKHIKETDIEEAKKYISEKLDTLTPEKIAEPRLKLSQKERELIEEQDKWFWQQDDNKIRDLKNSIWWIKYNYKKISESPEEEIKIVQKAIEVRKNCLTKHIQDYYGWKQAKEKVEKERQEIREFAKNKTTSFDAVPVIPYE